MPQKSKTALVAYLHKMGRLIEQLAPEYNLMWFNGSLG